jgi:large subunit ribosomal protein L9
MKIILTSTVSGLGKVGDTIEVKNGHAKNFLIPAGKAICYSENNVKRFEENRSDYEKASSDLLDLANHVKNQFIGKNLVIIENASDDGRLYGSVNSVVIAAKINEEVKKDIVKKTDIVLTKPIKEIGVYEIVLEVHPESAFTIKLVVSRLESEVNNLLKAFEKQQKDEAKKEAAEKSAAEKASDKTEEVSVLEE